MPKLSMPTTKFAILASTALCAFTVTTAHADPIIVNTIADDVTKNEKCSLREAIAYVNAGQTDKESECHPKDNTPNATIVLSGKETYETKSELNIKVPMTIKADNFDGLSNKDGAEQSILKSTGHRLFVIDDQRPDSTSIRVDFQGIRLQGPYAGLTEKQTLTDAQINSLIDEGGLVLNRESLSINKCTLSGGAAKKGGAIANVSADASLSLTATELYRNFSDVGSAIFSELATVSLVRSLVNDNRPVSVAKGFAIEIDSAINVTGTITRIPEDKAKKEGDKTVSPYTGIPLAQVVTNTIFYNNKVGVMTLKPGMSVNNITAIENAYGIDLGSGFDVENPDDRVVVAARLANSVILNSSNYDIRLPKNDFTFLNNLVIQKDRVVDESDKTITTFSDNRKQYIEAVNLLALTPAQSKGLLAAVEVETNGKKEVLCKAPTAGETIGLFCPLLKLENEYIATIKPRLLMSYVKLSDSPIINKGNVGTSKLNQRCQPDDVRGEKRGSCDIGAFEVVITKADAGAKTANDEIEFGETAVLDLKDVVGDGQLIPAKGVNGESLCDAFITNPTKDAALWPSGKVGVWTDGCILYTSRANLPTKGVLKASKENNKLVYTPSSNFHGLDEFEYTIVTTTSRFSEAQSERQLKVRSVVLQEPPNTFTSRTLDLGYGSSNGGFGQGSVLFLIALYGLRRRFNNKDLK